MITFDDVSKTYAGAGGRAALTKVGLSVAAGEVFGVIGASGAGKSTLIRLINGLEKPSGGRVVVDGDDVAALGVEGLRSLRRRVGMIFQHFNLLSSKTVAGNVAFPLKLAGRPEAEVRARTAELLARVGLTDFAGKYPAQLSGGQKQRVGIARALANQPKVLLSDEATSALDPETTRSILELLRRINRELGLTIVLITHQMEVIKAVCDRMAVMDAGRVIEHGAVIDVFRQPQHEVTRALIGDVISQELPRGVLERVRARLADTRAGTGRDHLFRFAFTGSGVDQPLLSEAVRRFGLDFNILHGQIDEIQGQAFGSLAVLASGEPASVAEAVQFFRSHGVVVEELNHVI